MTMNDEQPAEMMKSASERVKMSFTQEELHEMWNALAQYLENHDEDELPAAAVSAQEKLDWYTQLLADPTLPFPSGGG